MRDACAYVQEHCPDIDGDGIIPYARIYYCASSSARSYLLVFFFLWLMVLFSAMATAAGDFLSIHLAVIVRILNISENLAGVTIFAFGNGSSDLFSTLAAMNSNRGSLAISELFGAAAFITTVVLGFVMVVHLFSVDPNTFVGDVLWFIIAATVLMAFIADGYLTLSECVGIIGLYIAFVCFAILRAKNPQPETSAAEINNVQYLEEHGEPSENIEGLSDENTPMLAPENTPTKSRISSTDFAERQPSCASGGISIDSGPDNVDTGMGSHSDDSSMASNVCGTEPENTNADQRSWRWALLRLIFGPFMTSWKDHNPAERALSILSIPFLIPISLTTPSAPVEYFQGRNTQVTSEEREESSTIAISRGPRRTNGDRGDQTRCPSTLSWFIERSSMCVPLILGTQFVGIVFVQQSGLLDSSIWTLLPVCLGSLMLSVTLIFCSSNLGRDPYNHTVALVI